MRFLPLLPLLVALSCSGCLFGKKKDPQAAAAVENSRSLEQRRMLKVENGDASSIRGAEILVPNLEKTFNPNTNAVGAVRSYGTGGARTKDFAFQQKAQTKNFLTRGFFGAKSNAAAERQYATSAAATRGKNELVEATKEAPSKTAATKNWWDGNKVAETRELADGDRPYLGRERKKIGNSIDAKSLADWRSGASESVTYNAGSVDRIGTLKQLSIEDVRELLNKNK